MAADGKREKCGGARGRRFCAHLTSFFAVIRREFRPRERAERHATAASSLASSSPGRNRVRVPLVAASKSAIAAIESRLWLMTPLEIPEMPLAVAARVAVALAAATIAAKKT